MTYELYTIVSKMNELYVTHSAKCVCFQLSDYI